MKYRLVMSRPIKRELVDSFISEHPNRANSWIAEDLKVSMQLVDSRRSFLECNNIINKYDKLVTRDGRLYPRGI